LINNLSLLSPRPTPQRRKYSKINKIHFRNKRTKTSTKPAIYSKAAEQNLEHKSYVSATLEEEEEPRERERERERKRELRKERKDDNKQTNKLQIYEN
jgi:hypothetical protein